MKDLLKFLKQQTKTEEFDVIRIGLSSPDTIRSWSFGEVKKPETINYRIPQHSPFNWNPSRSNRQKSRFAPRTEPPAPFRSPEPSLRQPSSSLSKTTRLSAVLSPDFARQPSRLSCQKRSIVSSLASSPIWSSNKPAFPSAMSSFAANLR